MNKFCFVFHRSACCLVRSSGEMVHWTEVLLDVMEVLVPPQPRCLERTLPSHPQCRSLLGPGIRNLIPSRTRSRYKWLWRQGAPVWAPGVPWVTEGSDSRKAIVKMVGEHCLDDHTG
uniref:Uncharacterized protein n=1 Tax=Cacopsylla melanoneura TaxID=428564 RepID=A0A8D8UZK0_9HEMI